MAARDRRERAALITEREDRETDLRLEALNYALSTVGEGTGQHYADDVLRTARKYLAFIKGDESADVTPIRIEKVA